MPTVHHVHINVVKKPAPSTSTQTAFASEKASLKAGCFTLSHHEGH